MASELRPPPTTAELDKLVAAWRDNPRSTSFLALADAYLSLGRPRDAVDVLGRGLQSHPDSVEGRLSLGRAHVLLHEWKEAQVELLKVVKMDRGSRDGFRLLGEVLMRRQDYERALPVLQHAANLNPADAGVLAMLRRAREGRPLDPPPPTPTPVAPSGSPAGGRRAPAFESDPTKVAGEEMNRLLSTESPTGTDHSGLEEPTSIMDDQRPARGPARPSAPPPAPPPRTARPSVPPPMSSDQAPIGRMPLKAESVRGAAEEKAARRVEDARAAEPVPERKRAPVPAAEDPFRPITERRPDEDSPRPQAPRPSERPRGTQQAPHKQKDAGAGEMRRSAAMGEDYLNQLLVGGLLSVPNVEAREHAPDAEERRRWRKKTRNAFILLWVLLILGAGGVGGYMFYARKRANEAVAKHLDAARTLMASGRQLDLARADGELQAALRVKGGDHLSLGTMAEERSLQLLWFGAGNIADVDAAVSAAGARLRDLPADAPGRREYAIGRVASLLAVLDRVQDPQQAIGEARKELDGALKAAPGDGMLLYLDGALRLALGDREGARASFEKSDTGGKGPPAARIAIGDLLLDSGDPEGAQQAYEAALGRSPQHPMALVGRALARVERSTDAEAAMQDLNVGLAGATGVRTEAWKHLAMSVVWAQLEDYDKSSKELDQAQQAGLGEPRFLARIALELLDRGKVTEAGLLRQKVHYFGEAPGRDPLMLLLDAELFMATGMPEDARAAVGENPTLRGHLVKGRALIDLGRPKDALAEFDAMLKIAPDDQLGKAYRELAVVLVAVAPGGDKSKGDASFENLAKMARSSVSGQVRYVFGEANLARGNVDDARRNFEASLEGENPLGYRARTRLAEVFLAAGRDDDAEKTLRDALDQSPVYAPARAALGRLLLKKGKIAEGVQELEPAVSAGRASAADELAYAGALVQLGRKDEAKAPLKRAKDKGAAPADLAAIAVQIDPAFVTELGLEGVKPPPGKKGGGK